MKSILALVLMGLALGCNSSQHTIIDNNADNIDPAVYAATITENELKELLYAYAADSMEGRETGKPGQKKAVTYLREHYRKMGIPPAKANGDYFQNVPLEIAKLPKGKVLLNGETYTVGDHVLTFNAAHGTYTGIAYAGHGIEEGTFSDYKNLDVKGKLVLVKAGEPKNSDGNYLVSGTEAPSEWSSMEAMEKKIALAQEKGAAGILYFDAENFNRFKRRFDFMEQNKSERLSLKPNTEAPFVSFFIDDVLAKAILPGINEDSAPKTVTAQMNMTVESANEDINSENVVAFIRGSEFPDEYIIISSHLDHIGITPQGLINNGADDDGSGTVGLLEIAQAFKEAADNGNGPKRSVVFLHVTGEEKGLLGSMYYTDMEPVFPLENTVANLNIDMIGRIDPKREGNSNYVYLIGSDKLSTTLHELSENTNEKCCGLELDYTYNDENDPNRFYYRSDHYNFAKNNIPVIFYFNGTHEDYHRPTDTPDKINYDLLQNRARLIFHTAWEIANRAQRITADKATE